MDCDKEDEYMLVKTIADKLSKTTKEIEEMICKFELISSDRNKSRVISIEVQ